MRISDWSSDVCSSDLLAFLALWAAAAGLAGRSEVPGPLAVLTFVVREPTDGTLFYHLAVTLDLVAAAFLIAMVVGAPIGVPLGQHSRIHLLLAPCIILLIHIPAPAVILLRYIIIRLTNAPAVQADNPHN